MPCRDPRGRLMRRREFITLIGGIAILWPLAVRGQQSDHVRRIGVFVNTPASSPVGKARVAVFQQALQELGWTGGKRLEVDYRWRDGHAASTAADLVKLAPDVILVAGTTNLAAVQQATRTTPIVFVNVTDPVGGGFVSSLARPGGNTTGFTQFEYSIGGKWLELLKQVAPGVMRVGVLRNPAIASGIGQFSAVQSAAQSLSVELSPIDVREASAIERAVGELKRSPNCGLIVTSSAFSISHRELISRLAARYRLPAIYPFRNYATSGGLISYGPDIKDEWRRAAAYVDRILKGEKPGDLPVQAPTKFELVINLKTAKKIGLTIPATLLTRADEVIE
jgi:putative ABC transport system substrate-binding protein